MNTALGILIVKFDDQLFDFALMIDGHRMQLLHMLIAFTLMGGGGLLQVFSPALRGSVIVADVFAYLFRSERTCCS